MNSRGYIINQFAVHVRETNAFEQASSSAVLVVIQVLPVVEIVVAVVSFDSLFIEQNVILVNQVVRPHREIAKKNIFVSIPNINVFRCCKVNYLF